MIKNTILEKFKKHKEAKIKEETTETGKRKREDDDIPPPPSAAQVVREMKKERRRKESRADSQSPAPTGLEAKEKASRTSQSPAPYDIAAKSVSPAPLEKRKSSSPGPSLDHPKKKRILAPSGPSTPSRESQGPMEASMTQEDLIKVVKAHKEGGISVKEIVAGLLKNGISVQNNQENIKVMKDLMKRCLDHDKNAKLLTLKKEFRDSI